MYYKFSDFDMYSKKLGFFLKNKEQIGSCFSLILTIIYILFSLNLLFFYLNYILGRKDLKIYNSKIYSIGIPKIEVNQNILYFAFGIENSNTSNRFVDETIYVPKITFYDKKKINGEFYNIEKRELEYEICNTKNFGEELRDYFNESELNNSYCLKNYNLTLSGGYKYEKMSFFAIKIYPCLNTSENNNHCKPQEIIDSYLKEAYFSILTKDIELIPKNYSFPILYILEDLYTTIDKQMYRDYILYYGITELQIDDGLFYPNIKIQKYLKFNKEKSTFYFRDESDYYTGKPMISIEFRIDDIINVQKREYAKLGELFSHVGGYMQSLYTIFNLLCLLPNKIFSYLEIINGLFYFNIKENKINIKINSIKDLNSKIFNKNTNNYINFPYSKKIDNNIYNRNNNTGNISRNNLICAENNNNENSSIVNIINNKNGNSSNNKNYNSKLSDLNNKNKKHNKNKKIFINNNSNTKIKTSNSKNYIYRVGSFFPKKQDYIKENGNDNEYISEKNSNILKENFEQLKINFFTYYFCCRFKKRKKELGLFDSSINIYKKRMDIINVFTLLFLTEKTCLKLEK